MGFVGFIGLKTERFDALRLQGSKPEPSNWGFEV